MRKIIALLLLTSPLYGEGTSAQTGPVYDDAGHQTAYVYPDGKKETYAYDSHWRMISFHDRAGNLTTYSYADDGSVSVSRAKAGNSTR